MQLTESSSSPRHKVWIIAFGGWWQALRPWWMLMPLPYGGIPQRGEIQHPPYMETSCKFHHHSSPISQLDAQELSLCTTGFKRTWRSKLRFPHISYRLSRPIYDRNQEWIYSMWTSSAQSQTSIISTWVIHQSSSQNFRNWMRVSKVISGACRVGLWCREGEGRIHYHSLYKRQAMFMKIRLRVIEDIAPCRWKLHFADYGIKAKIVRFFFQILRVWLNTIADFSCLPMQTYSQSHKHPYTHTHTHTDGLIYI